jgi:trimethylamine--corrinoid protein Co-methyltransferase
MMARQEMFVNRMPRYEVLSEEAMATLDRGWRRIVSELGIEFLLPEAVELLKQAGQIVEDSHRVRFDPEWILEQVAKAPREFELQARNPAHTAHIGGDHMVFAPVYGCPFIREGEVRRDAKMADFENLVKLSQSFAELDSPGGTICEPEDRPLDSRHLDMVFALQTLTDKPYMGSVTSGPNAADTIRMGEILFGGRERIEQAPVSISLINVNSPLRYDDRMLAATLVQQMAEALAGIALAQTIRPGAPVVFGSFLSNTDMQSGSPSFGTPESGIGVLCTGQIARHFGLPWRGGGALNASQTVDAQAAYESLMTFLPTFLAGANFVMHSAGWLEGGLVSCYEKFIVDIELLRELKYEFTPLEIDEASLAFDAHLEVGAGGHFLGAAHTLERFRECFYRPLLSSTENFDRWTKRGAKDTTSRAAEIWRATLESYEPPPLDEAIRAELSEFVDRRRAELGD